MSLVNRRTKVGGDSAGRGGMETAVMMSNRHSSPVPHPVSLERANVRKVGDGGGGGVSLTLPPLDGAATGHAAFGGDTWHSVLSVPPASPPGARCRSPPTASLPPYDVTIPSPIPMPPPRPAGKKKGPARARLGVTQSSGFDAIQDALLLAVAKLGADEAGEDLTMDEKWAILSRHMEDAMQRGRRLTQVQRLEQLCTDRERAAAVLGGAGSPTPRSSPMPTALLCARLDTVLGFCAGLSPSFEHTATQLRRALHAQLFCTEPKVAARLAPIDCEEEVESLAALYGQHRTFRDLVAATSGVGSEPSRVRMFRKMVDGTAQQALRAAFRGWRGAVRWGAEERVLRDAEARRAEEAAAAAALAAEAEERARRFELSLKHHQVRYATLLREGADEQRRKVAATEVELQRATERISALEEQRAAQRQLLADVIQKSHAKEAELRGEISRLEASLDEHIPLVEPENNAVRTELLACIDDATGGADAMRRWVGACCAGLWGEVLESEANVSLFEEEAGSADIFASSIHAIHALPAVTRRSAEERTLTDVKGILLALREVLQPSRREAVPLKDIAGCSDSSDAIELLTAVGSQLGLRLPIASFVGYRTHVAFRVAAACAVARAVLSPSLSDEWILRGGGASGPHGSPEGASPAYLRASAGVEQRVISYEASFRRAKTLLDAACFVDAQVADACLSSLSEAGDAATERSAAAAMSSVDPGTLAGMLAAAGKHADDTEEEAAAAQAQAQENAEVMAPYYRRLSDVYAYYAVGGRMGRMEAASFVRDIKLVGAGGDEMGSGAGAGSGGRRKSLGGARLEMCRQLEIDDQSHFDLKGFLLLVTRAAQMVKQTAKTGTEPQLQILIARHILPHAYSSSLDSLVAAMAAPEVEELLETERPFLAKMFGKHCVGVSVGGMGGSGAENRVHVNRRKSALMLQYGRIGLQGFKRLAEEYKLVDDSLTQLALQQAFARLVEDENEDGLQYSEFLVLLAVVACYRFPTPFFSLSQKLRRLLSLCSVRASMEGRRR